MKPHAPGTLQRSRFLTLVSSQVLTLLSCLILPSCQTTPILSEANLSNAAPVRGMVYDWDRLPVPFAKITLTPVQGEAYVTETDIHGRYSFDGVRFGHLALVAEKAGYETERWEFDFTEASQVGYSQISNAAQLAEQAVVALEARDWSNASGLIARAKALQPTGPLVAFLDAYLLVQGGQYQAAVTLLQQQLATNPTSFTLEVYLATIYEQQLSNQVEAMVHWKKALALRNDPSIAAKVANAEGKL